MRFWALVSALALATAGCASPYSIKIAGDVEGSDADTPRDVRAGIHEGADKIRTTYEAAKGHLHPLADAQVTIGYILRNRDKPEAETKVPAPNAKFQWEVSAEDGGPLTSVIVKVESPGREPVTRSFPCVAGVPFDAQLMAVLDAIEVGPAGPGPVDTSTAGGKTPGIPGSSGPDKSQSPPGGGSTGH